MGRRTADDARQIRRWRAIARHVTAIRKNCETGDLECRPRQRQAVLHWAYDSRQISGISQRSHHDGTAGPAAAAPVRVGTFESKYIESPASSTCSSAAIWTPSVPASV